MRIYMLHIFIFEDSCEMHLSQDKLGSIHFPIPFWFGEPDWHKVRKAIEFFNPEWVIISPRFSNADDFTSAPVEVNHAA